MRTLAFFVFALLFISCANDDGTMVAPDGTIGLPADSALVDTIGYNHSQYRVEYLPNGQKSFTEVDSVTTQTPTIRPGGNALSHAYFYATAYLETPPENMRADCARALTLDGAIHEMMAKDSVWLPLYGSLQEVMSMLETIHIARVSPSHGTCFPNSDIFTRFQDYDPYGMRVRE